MDFLFMYIEKLGDFISNNLTIGIFFWSIIVIFVVMIVGIISKELVEEYLERKGRRQKVIKISQRLNDEKKNDEKK